MEMNKCPFHKKQPQDFNSYVNFSDIKNKVGSLLKNTRGKLQAPQCKAYIKDLKNNTEKYNKLKGLIKDFELIESLVRKSNFDEENDNEIHLLHQRINDTQEFLEFIEISWNSIEPIINSSLDNLVEKIDNFDYKTGDISSSVNQALNIMYEVMGEEFHKLRESDSAFEYLYQLSPGKGGYFMLIFFESGLEISGETFAAFIEALLDKGVDNKNEIEDIILKNRSGIIDIARSNKINEGIKAISENGRCFVFDDNFNLNFNMNEEELDILAGLDTKEPIEYKGCPMLYSKGGRYDKNNLIDFSTIMTKLILNGIDFEKIKKSKIA